MEKLEKYELIADYYYSHYEELLGFVSKRLQYSDAAEDIVQDVFVRLLRTDKMITPVTMPSLVYTIARNIIFDYWRHKRSVEEYEHYLVTTDRNNTLDTSYVYGAGEMTELLEQGIARLSDNQREIYRMNIYEGMQVSDISDKLNLKYKNVENRLGMARKEVRRYISSVLRDVV